MRPGDWVEIASISRFAGWARVVHVYRTGDVKCRRESTGEIVLMPAYLVSIGITRFFEQLVFDGC